MALQAVIIATADTILRQPFLACHARLLQTVLFAAKLQTLAYRATLDSISKEEYLAHPAQMQLPNVSSAASVGQIA